MATPTLLSDHSVLWRVLMVTPSGYVEMVEVRASNAALALDTAQDWKPCHRVATDPRGTPLVCRVGDPVRHRRSPLPDWVSLVVKSHEILRWHATNG